MQSLKPTPLGFNEGEGSELAKLHKREETLDLFTFEGVQSSLRSMTQGLSVDAGFLILPG